MDFQLTESQLEIIKNLHEGISVNYQPGDADVELLLSCKFVESVVKTTTFNKTTWEEQTLVITSRGEAQLTSAIEREKMLFTANSGSIQKIIASAHKRFQKFETECEQKEKEKADAEKHKSIRLFKSTTKVSEDILLLLKVEFVENSKELFLPLDLCFSVENIDCQVSIPGTKAHEICKFHVNAVHHLTGWTYPTQTQFFGGAGLSFEDCLLETIYRIQNMEPSPPTCKIVEEKLPECVALVCDPETRKTAIACLAQLIQNPELDLSVAVERSIKAALMLHSAMDGKESKSTLLIPPWLYYAFMHRQGDF